MAEISIFRLYLLRACYLLIGVGLAMMIFPGIINPSENTSHMTSVVRSLLGAISILSFVGIRYPLKMLPILFFELLWKAIWILAFGLRLWTADRLDADNAQTLGECIFGVVIVSMATPWDYIFNHYFAASGDPWRKTA